MEQAADSRVSEEEIELWARVRGKDAEARRILIERYLGEAKQVAIGLFARRVSDDVDLNDYIQLAVVGLIEAVDRYDASRDASFKTFGRYRIKGAILNGLEKYSEKRGQLAYKRRVRKERVKSVADGVEMGRFGELVDVAVDLVMVRFLEDEAGENMDNIDAGGCLYTNRFIDETRSQVRKAIERLPERERVILQYHYFRYLGFEEIGRILGVSKGRVSQIHKEALEKLRGFIGGEIDLYL